MFSYKESKNNVIDILTSKTPIQAKRKIPQDSSLTYENGVRTWVASIFVDIENSTKLFKNQDEKIARLIRAFSSEIITIFQDFVDYNQIGIRGDCVYAIYDIATTDDMVDIFRIAYRINTFINMFNSIIINYGYHPINVGIGLGCGHDLVVKAGKEYTGINDKIWIGSAVVDASNLSSVAGRNGYGKIAMSKIYYNNIIKKLTELNPEYNQWIICEPFSDIGTFYHCDIIQIDFQNWINEGMR